MIEKLLPETYLEEIEAHFNGMPDRYFLHRGSTSIARHVKLFRKFFEVVKRDTLESMVPVVGWEARPDEGYTLFEVAGWNRHHLAAKVAGALAARNLNILAADLFTREDDLVLDVFRVCTTNFGPVNSKREIERIEKMLAEEFGVGDEEVDFQALIAKQSKPSILQKATPMQQADFDIPQRVFLSNELDPNTTVLELQAKDRIGLLYDIFTALGNLGCRNFECTNQHSGRSRDRPLFIDRYSLGRKNRRSRKARRDRTR